MPSLVTEKGKVATANRVLSSFQSNTQLNHYMFAADHLPSTSSDRDAVAPNNSEHYQFYQMQDRIIFGKMLTAADAASAIRYYPWTEGTVYAAYDDRDPDLHTKKFFTVSKEGSNYSIFKCLSNNRGKPSTISPKASETSFIDNLYQTSDQYVWKLMYTISTAQFEKFRIGNDWIPIIDTNQSSSKAVRGGIHAVVVENSGSKYNSFTSGSFRAINISGNTLIHSIQSDGVLSSNTDFYKYCGLYIKSGKGAGQLVQIDEYIVTGSDRRVVMKENFPVAPDLTSRFDIAPFAEIVGDGSGAKAIVTMNTVANSIHSVQMVNIGKDYSVADVNIISGATARTSNTAGVRAIISPNGGHGANIKNELFATSIVLSTSFVGNEGLKLPVANDYRVTGVIENPVFANTVVTLDSTFGFAPTQKVRQDNGLSATVSAVNIDGVNTLRLKDIQGTVDVGKPMIASNTTNSSIATSNVVTKDRELTLFDNRSAYSVAPISPLSSFIMDEKITQAYSGAYGYLHSIQDGVMFLTGVVGTFSVSDFTIGFEAELVGETSKAVAQITGYSQPDLVKNRGECLYIQSSAPINRGADQTERLKILVEF